MVHFRAKPENEPHAPLLRAKRAISQVIAIIAGMFFLYIEVLLRAK
ncbi:MAG: hypothetical protein U5L45_24380 [Saprospiraceae bacterium]|nr:hypothetical protein [Saprospiraceae bacterium]